MKRTFVIALAGAVTVGCLAETTPAARAAETSPARSVEAVRLNALAAMNAGQIEQVQWRGNRKWRGRGHHGRRHYHRRGRGGGGAAVAAGVAGLAVGAMIAGSAARAENRADAKRWCADRYRSYDWRSETFVGNDGRRRACP